MLFCVLKKQAESKNNNLSVKLKVNYSINQERKRFMATLILHDKKILSVKESTSDIERQKQSAGSVFRFHLLDSSKITMPRKDVLMMEDGNNESAMSFVKVIKSLRI